MCFPEVGETGSGLWSEKRQSYPSSKEFIEPERNYRTTTSNESAVFSEAYQSHAEVKNC